MKEPNDNKPSKVSSVMGKILADILVICIGVCIVSIIIALTLKFLGLLF